MKKEKLFFCLFILYIALFYRVSAFEYSESIQKQETSLTITNKVYTTASGLDANLSLLPITDERQSSEITTFPQAESNQEEILFSFKEKGTLVFGLESNVTTIFLLKRLREISLQDISSLTGTSELNFYKKSSNYSNSDNPAIKNKALQIAQKTENSIQVLYLLAEYVHNSMNYDLNSSDLKKASQILEEKKGVCAHYTILFISLAKSLGFPARYISGVAYSNLFNESQEHAWAEVYLPESGWVPYDVTFGQYGWLDTSHIALKKSRDAGESSVRYSYLGGYVQPEQISIDAQVLDFEENTPENFAANISIELFPYKEKVSQESYIPVKARIKNDNDFYISLPIRVSVAPEVYGESEKILFLEPLSEKEIYFIIYIPYEKECKKGCLTYVVIADSFKDSSQINLTFSDYFDKVSLEEALEVINETNVSEIDFYCISNSTLGDKIKSIICNIRPQASEVLKFCYHDNCTERYFEKLNLEQIPLKIETNESHACFELVHNDLSLNSCVNFNKSENRNFFQKLWDKIMSWIISLNLII